MDPELEQLYNEVSGRAPPSPSGSDPAAVNDGLLRARASAIASAPPSPEPVEETEDAGGDEEQPVPPPWDPMSPEHPDNVKQSAVQAAAMAAAQRAYEEELGRQFFPAAATKRAGDGKTSRAYEDSGGKRFSATNPNDVTAMAREDSGTAPLSEAEWRAAKASPSGWALDPSRVTGVAAAMVPPGQVPIYAQYPQLAEMRDKYLAPVFDPVFEPETGALRRGYDAVSGAVQDPRKIRAIGAGALPSTLAGAAAVPMSVPLAVGGAAAYAADKLGVNPFSRPTQPVAMAPSDRRLKRMVKPAKSATMEFLEALARGSHG
jgi:hypothetical protein